MIGWPGFTRQRCLIRHFFPDAMELLKIPDRVNSGHGDILKELIVHGA
jgi:hypothetical protein